MFLNHIQNNPEGWTYRTIRFSGCKNLTESGTLAIVIFTSQGRHFHLTFLTIYQ